MSKLCRRKFLKRGSSAALALMCPGLIQLGCDGGADGAPADLAGGLDTLPPEDLLTGDVAEEIVRRAGATIHATLGQSVSDFYQMGIDAAKSLGFTGTNLKGATVFLKPNFVTLGLEIFGCQFDPAVGECTKPELVAAVAEQCLAAGAGKVIIGEGAQKSWWEWDVLRFNEGTEIGGATNLLAAADRLKTTYGDDRLELVCLNQADQWTALPSGSSHENMKDGLFVSTAFADADHVISMPVMKTHTFAKMTAAMKNYVGVISSNIHGNGISRCWAHLGYKDDTVHGVEMAGISGGFMDIHKWRMDEGHEDFAIMDATICLEGTGPHTAPVNAGLTIHTKDRNAAGAYALLASNDLAANDLVASQLMGLPEADVKALRMARNIGLGELDAVHLKGASIDELKISDWLPPEMEGEDYFEFVCKNA